jgi:hypothetical protein
MSYPFGTRVNDFKRDCSDISDNSIYHNVCKIMTSIKRITNLLVNDSNRVARRGLRMILKFEDNFGMVRKVKMNW